MRVERAEQCGRIMIRFYTKADIANTIGHQLSLRIHKLCWSSLRACANLWYSFGLTVHDDVFVSLGALAELVVCQILNPVVRVQITTVTRWLST